MRKKILAVCMVLAALVVVGAGAVLFAGAPSWMPEGWQPVTWEGSCRSCPPNTYLVRSLCDTQNGDRLVLLAKWVDPSDPATLEYVGGPAVVPGGCAQPLRQTRKLPTIEAPAGEVDAAIGAR